MSGPRVVRNGPLSEKEPAKAGLQKPKEDNGHLTQPIYVILDPRAGPLIPALGLQRNQSSSSCRLSPPIHPSIHPRGLLVHLFCDAHLSMVG
jgi:hypothetical protein